MTHVPTDAQARKAIPLCTGALDYFPDALMAVAELSRVGNEQHNPGQPLHWAKEKSTDEPDALLRHLVDRGKIDVDGVRHSAKVAWRALALLQREIDAEKPEKELERRACIPVCDEGTVVRPVSIDGEPAVLVAYRPVIIPTAVPAPRVPNSPAMVDDDLPF